MPKKVVLNSSEGPMTARIRDFLSGVSPRCFSVSLWLCGSFAFASSALAAETAPGVGAFSVLKVLLGLGVVLAAVVGAGWLARRLSPTPLGGGWLKVQSGISVGTRERVMLVEIQDTWLVLGVAPGQVSLLHSLPRPAEAAAASHTGSQQANFSAWLKTTLERRNRA
jgi:flagellar protein FliO/FliZ